jgi:2-dehydro-3-deoxyphosphogluconate aldolase / (4S)-4-hydroxy-2-oxoglutarate aldolase
MCRSADRRISILASQGGRTSLPAPEICMSAARSKLEVLAGIRAGTIIPVIRADSATTALAVVEALVEAGIRTLEITMTVPDALAAIAAVARRFGPGVVLGAGTVTTREAAEAALDAGAEFLVTPAVMPDVVAVARHREVAVLPGALTPTEVVAAWSAGGDIVKIFPASAVGGPAYLRALKGPFPEIPLCPTGGVNLQTIGEYVKAGADAVGIGGELVSKAAIARGDFGAITSLARQYIEALAAARGR